MNQVVNRCKLIVLVFLDHVLNLDLRLWCYFVHSVKNFVINGHWMETYNNSDDFWFDFADLFEKSKLSQLRNGDSFARISD